MSQIQSEIQKLSPSASVSLFVLDTSEMDGGLFYFVCSAHVNQPIMHGGIEYKPIDVEFTGMETSGVGALPTPQLSITNTDNFVQSLINTLGDLNGADLYRYRTYARFLDGEPDADSTAIIGPDIYKIERKSTDTPDEVVWDLSASIDQEGKMLPGRPMVRDTCLFRYRTWDAAQSRFLYDRAICPYAGTDYFDADDNPTTADKDKPSRTVNCCRIRFGEGNAWPFGGFPGMGRNL